MSANPPSSASTQQGGSRTKLYAGIAVAVLVVLLGIAVAVWMYLHPADASVIRDIFVFALACETIFIGLALLVLIWQIYRLTRMIQNEIKPVVHSANETMTTVRGTTVFVSNNLVNPMIRVASTVAGAKRAIDVLTGRNYDTYLED